MPITNDNELRTAVGRISKDLQDVQNYLGDRNHPDAKIRFPWGYLRRAAGFREEIAFINDPALKRNLAYAHITSDIYRWLINRTTIVGTAREMILKEGICLVGAIVESLTKAVGIELGVCGKQTSYEERCARLRVEGIVSPELAGELLWLWRIRRNEHLFLVDGIEYQAYELRHYNRAIIALRSLKHQCSDYFENLKVPF